MKILAPDLYKIILTNKNMRTSSRNLYIIKGSERSLMIDTSWNVPECLSEMEQALNELSINCRDLDIFVTHNHVDHSGYVSFFTYRGARAFMNPLEIAASSDRYHRFYEDNDMRRSYTSEVGVTKERTPDAWQEIKAGADQLARDNNVNFDFPFTPIAPGDRLSYGGYDFEVVSLAGHTSGQCGLVERNAKLFFCADQVILGLVPIVITSGKDQHLLTEYFASLRELASDYSGYRFLPGHYGEFTEIKEETDRIIAGYGERCTQLRQALAESNRPMTLLELDQALYIQRMQTYRYSFLFSYLHTWPKLFSCLDWLFETGVIARNRTEFCTGLSGDTYSLRPVLSSASLFENTHPQ